MAKRGFSCAQRTLSTGSEKAWCDSTADSESDGYSRSVARGRLKVEIGGQPLSLQRPGRADQRQPAAAVPARDRLCGASKPATP